MRFNRLFPALAATVVLLAVILACGGDDDDTSGATTPATTAATVDYPMTLTDDGGTEVTLETQPQRIVALAPSFVEVLFEIGAVDTIVAADENTDEPPEASSIPKVSGFEPSVEGIASYQPDLVLMCCSDAGGLQGALTQLDIPTMYFDTPTTVEGVYDQIQTIGAAVGHPDEAADVVSQMQSDIDAIVSTVGQTPGPGVFFELDPGLFTVGPGSFTDEVLTLLGASNVAEATGAAYPQMTAEAIIASNPEVIILADADFGESPETVAARPGWSDIGAVQNNRIYPVTGGFLNHASPRLVEDIHELAALLYPEIF